MNYLLIIKTFLTAKAIWLKIVAAIIMAVAVMLYCYNAGKDVERGIWQKRESNLLADIEKANKEADERVDEQHRKHEEILIKVMGEHNETVQNLNNDIDNFKRVGLRFKGKVSRCSPASAGKAESTSILAEEIEYELPAGITESLSRIGKHAQLKQAERNELIDICSQYVEAAE